MGYTLLVRVGAKLCACACRESGRVTAGITGFGEDWVMECCAGLLLCDFGGGSRDCRNIS